MKDLGKQIIVKMNDETLEGRLKLLSNKLYIQVEYGKRHSLYLPYYLTKKKYVVRYK